MKRRYKNAGRNDRMESATQWQVNSAPGNAWGYVLVGINGGLKAQVNKNRTICRNRFRDYTSISSALTGRRSL
ncbi:hypothetical protein LJC72_11085 [Bacteroides sp. OttesenSCG-928-D19]|nr:hypothetical protein [Bacteroides sp. OttesenSCG-928-D19]